MSLSVGSLMAALWNRFNAAMAAQDPKVLEVVEEFGSEAAFIKSVGDAADAVNDYFAEWFNDCDHDWNIIHIDVDGIKEESLDSAIWAAICGKTDVTKATENWVKNFIPHALWE